MSARILVVNDEISMLELFQLILEPAGYEVHISEYFFEDVADVERLCPDLIILDLKSGREYRGWDLLHTLKQYPTTISLPIIVSSAAHDEIYDHQDYLDNHQIPALFKPFDVEEVLEAVRRVLSLV